MGNVVPLISSGVAGPLGVLHLPRLWQKVSLSNAGQLHDEYPAIGAGYDQMVLDGLGLDKGAFEGYMAASKPSYNQLEDWVLDQSGGSLDTGAVDELNSAIRGFNHNDETRKSVCECCGIDDDGSILDAVNLNNLEDWATFHQQLNS